MTCQEIGEYCEQQAKRLKDDYITMASTGYRLVGLLMNMFTKHPQNITFDKLFPEFGIETEEKEKTIAEKWREFLGR